MTGTEFNTTVSMYVEQNWSELRQH
jgi:hypothetical protein